MDSDKPTWVWINLNNFDISVIRALGITSKKPLKKRENMFMAKDLNKELRHRRIGHGIRQYTTPYARAGNSKVNRSIMALAEPGHIHVYFTAAIFFGFRTSAEDGASTKIFYEDATPRDLRMITDWYLTRPENPCVVPAYRNRLDVFAEEPDEIVTSFTGVKINCDIDRLRFFAVTGEEQQTMEEVTVLSKDPCNMRRASVFVEMAGLPWMIQQCMGSYDILGDGDDSVELLRNIQARVFNVGFEGADYTVTVDKNSKINIGDKRDNNGDNHQPSSSSTVKFSIPRRIDSSNRGTIIVMRKDGRDINILHVLAFYRFVEQVLADNTNANTSINNSFSNSNSNNKAENVVAHDEQGRSYHVIPDALAMRSVINRANFEKYWDEWTRETEFLIEGDYPSPYCEGNDGDGDEL